MDDYASRRTVGENFSRRHSSVGFRDQSHNEKRNQYCSKLECSSSHNSMKGVQIGTREKPKYTRPSLRPLSGKAIAESSSRSISTSNSYRSSFQEEQNPAFLRQLTIPESSDKHRGVEAQDKSHTGTFLENLDSDDRQEEKESPDSVAVTMECIESALIQEISSDIADSSINCSAESSSKQRKQSNGRSSYGKQDVSSSFFARRSTEGYRTSSHAAKPISQGLAAGTQRSSLKKLSCLSISDVIPSGCSSSDFTCDRKVDTVRKGTSDGESSSVRSKATSIVSSGGYSVSANPSTSALRLPARERAVNLPHSRRIRNQPTTRECAVSPRTQQASAGENRLRLSRKGDDIIPSEPTMIPQINHTQLSVPEASPESSSRSFSIEMPHVFYNTSGRPGSSSRASRTRPVSHPEDSSTVTSHGSLRVRDGYRRFNVEGVAEVLLALERIEQDEELTYEQLLVLETSLFFGGLSFYDQHRDMRMDIDNMSYEELLALEERMGTVSIALSEEQLSKCLKRSVYAFTSLVPGSTVRDDCDVKCSICQEEYVGGDETGKLPCKHHYHVACIQQWLRQKNWCPICKSSALSSKNN